MDNNSINYQRAVTPLIDSTSNGSNSYNTNASQVKGKTLTYQQQPLRKPINSKILSFSNPPLSNIPSDPLRSGQSGRPPLYTNLSGQHSPTRVLQRGMISPRLFSANTELNLSGKAFGISPTAAKAITSIKFDENDPTDKPSSSGELPATHFNYEIIPISEEIPADGIIFARYRDKPDTLVIYRTNEERANNPERLNLDRRMLDSCPIIEYENQLRLLNYQNNRIKQIQHVENLNSLIFLDVYNNRIVSLDGPLSSLKGLRVLMAGKNKISTITNLVQLKKLDVLDLHSNDISSIEGLDSQSELRVLNLAGNRITSVSNILSLKNLTEINLRRNSIERVFELDRLPALQRVFLSHNRIASIGDIKCIFNIKLLVELSLDNNPVSDHDSGVFRQFMITAINSLKYFDFKPVTELDRDSAKQDQELAVTSYASKSQVKPNKVESSASSVSSSLQDVKPIQSPSIPIVVQSTVVSAKPPPPIKNDESKFLDIARKGKVPNVLSVFDVETLDSEGSKAVTIVGEFKEIPKNKKQLGNVVELSLCRIKCEELVGMLKISSFSTFVNGVKILRLIKNGLSSLSDLERISDLFVESIEAIEIYENPLIGQSTLTDHPLNIILCYYVWKLPNLNTVNEIPVGHINRTDASRILENMLKIPVLQPPIKNARGAQIKDLPTADVDGYEKDTVSATPDDKAIAAKQLIAEMTTATRRRRKIEAAFDSLFERAMVDCIKQAIANTKS